MTENTENQFRLLMARNEHLKRMVAKYSTPEIWETFEAGDQVIIKNPDSLHDRQIGTFIVHQWHSSGYVTLLVSFPDGKRVHYLPTQVFPPRDTDDVVTPTPQPQSKGFKFRIANQEELEDTANKIIEAKLAQVAKMPLAARKKILSSTLSSELIPKALEIAKQRGIIPE